ncbi:MAG: hypothetical protein ACYC3V_03245 [Chloroflexota bacterium]
MVLLRGVAYALLSPPFTTPDERDHFQYIASLATGGEAGTRGREGHQPVLYYALMVPAYWISMGHSEVVQLLAIRLFSVPLLLAQVGFAWLAAARLVPGRPLVALVASGIVALQPQLAYIGASANNDAVANLVGAALAFLVVSLLTERRWWTPPALVLAIAAAVLSKGQLLPVAALAWLLLLAVLGWRALDGSGRALVYLLPVALLAGLAALVRESSILVERTQFLLNALQRWPQALEGAERYGSLPYWYQLVSFWSASMGESVHPATVWYLLPLAVVVLGLLGFLVGAFRGWRDGTPPDARFLLSRGVLLAMLPLQWAVVYMMFLQSVLDPHFSWTLQYMSGRYLLPTLVPLALLVAEGWGLLVPRRASDEVVGSTVLAVLLLFDVVAMSALLEYHAFVPDRLP